MRRHSSEAFVGEELLLSNEATLPSSASARGLQESDAGSARLFFFLGGGGLGKLPSMAPVAPDHPQLWMGDIWAIVGTSMQDKGFLYQVLAVAQMDQAQMATVNHAKSNRHRSRD